MRVLAEGAMKAEDIRMEMCAGCFIISTESDGAFGWDVEHWGGIGFCTSTCIPQRAVSVHRHESLPLSRSLLPS